MNRSKLIAKYSVPAPRYTSYPTVPYWKTTAPTQAEWERVSKLSFSTNNHKEGISLYIHLPFCESLCTYCGCNTRITKNHEVELPYITALLKEWAMYLDLFEETPQIAEIHLGGGTPTFFTADHLKQLVEGVITSSHLHKNATLSFEAHPANTTWEHVKTLRDLGFNRISIGVQDFNTQVQDIINRKQTYEQVAQLTQWAKELGYESVNYDLIYGLPLQTIDSVTDTVNKVINLQPDRIAFYSYAHVPWLKPGQRKYEDKDLPSSELKRKLYETGATLLSQSGYADIGMDHFALPTDELYKAAQKGKLYRNFMGYTTANTKLLVGLGVSSISDAWYGFVQNEKTVEEYYKRINNGELPIFKGHLLTEEDLIIRQHILNIICNYTTSWYNETEQCEALYEGIKRLEELENDHLLTLKPFELHVNKNAHTFMRNICMAFDARLWREKKQTTLFSNAI